MDNSEVIRTDTFRYLGSVLQDDGNIDKDVTKRINSGWIKWRAAAGVVCDKKNAPLSKWLFVQPWDMALNVGRPKERMNKNSMLLK